MYNTDLPTRAQLPTAAKLFRSMVIALVIAAVLLVTVVLPSEYGIDPTSAGRMLGLTQMGEIKKELSIEAALDQARAKSSKLGDTTAEADRFARIERRLDEISALLEQRTTPLASASSPDAVPTPKRQAEPAPAQQAAIPATPAAQPQWRDEISIVLAPGQGVELKLVMNTGAKAQFEWTANGSMLNYDTHGDGGGQSISYEKGRGVPEQSGVLEAAFDGNHGWFWRNRTGREVTLTLRTRGDYAELKRTA